MTELEYHPPMPRNRTKFTPKAVAQILAMVEQGMSSAEIAQRVGCTLGTLRVRCSQLKISLRHNPENGDTHSRKRNVLVDDSPRGGMEHPQPINDAQRQNEPLVRLTIPLPPITIEQLRQRAAAHGISDVTLAARLVQAIARDDLYEAVLDER
jgi:transposase-like protein